MDDLLDEIEDVLEENAETFVSNYIQKGAVAGGGLRRPGTGPPEPR